MLTKLPKTRFWGLVLTLLLTIGSAGILARVQFAAENRSNALPQIGSLVGEFLKVPHRPRFLTTSDATVRTNKSHYNPGETAKITGEDFGANEIVTLQVTHTDGTPPGGSGHDPWTVTTDDNGFFITTWYVNPDDSSGSAFLLTANSASASVSTTFSDPGPSADLDQCRNGSAANTANCIGDGSGQNGWVNGNVGSQQGHYIEGYSIPYRMRLAGMTAGSWTLDIGYDTVHSSAHAIDFLTHYDLIGGANTTPTVPSHNLVFNHSAECVDPSDSWIGLPANADNCAGVASTSTFTIPKPIIPVSVAGNPPGTPPCTTPYTGSDVIAGAISCPGTTFDAINGAGQEYMTMWNGTISNIVYVSGQQNVVSGQGQQHTMMRIYFTVSTAQAAADGGNVDLGWGGHIGRSTDWGAGNSAGGISGSPYHMNLHGLCAGSTPNDGTLCTDGGAQDRSLSAAAVFATGTVIIKKHMQAGSRDGTFNYTGTGTGIDPSFSLTTVSGDAQVTYSGVPAGSKTVVETGPSSPFLFVSLVCTDPDNGTTVSGQTANIDLDANETVTCTYTNREDFNATRGRIIVVKQTIPADSQSFTFTPSYPPFGGGTTFNLSNGQSNDSCGAGNDNCLDPNTYSVAETPNSSYSTTATCVSDLGDPADDPSAIHLRAGETVTCTFTNRKPDAKIAVSPLTATNEVNHAHTITATVQQDDTFAAGASGGDGATGFGPAPDGTLVTFSLLNNTAGAAFVGGVNTCTTAGGTGQCSVQINTSTAGGVDIHATTTFNVLTVSLTRATGTGGLNSADAHKTYVDAKIAVSPLTATNEVNHAHTITATVQQDDGIPAAGGGDGVTGFAPAPNGTLVTFSLLNNTAGAAFVGGVNTCTTAGGTGTCTVQINTSTAGGVDIHATTTFSVGGVSLTRATGTGGLNSADAHKTYVDAQIDLSPLTATNKVNQAHTITATVQQDDGIPAAGGGDGVTGFGPAPNGTLVTFSLLNNTAGAAFVGGVNTCTTTGGTCSVQINTSTPGSVDIHATTTFSVGGVSLTRATGTGGLNSADAHKTYVDAQIDLSPLTATNEVNHAHTITATVQQDDGIPAAGGGDGVTGFGPAPNGTLVTFSLLNNTAGAAFVGGVNTCTTTGGTCSVQINTSTAGGVDIHATATFSVGGQSFTVSTGTGGLNSADAHKTYVDAQIDLSPLTATNNVGQPHTITATVQQDDGIPAAGGGDGVTGFGPAPNGTLVTFSLLNNTANAVFVGGVSTCTTTGGTCSIQITSNTAGGVDIHATTTFSVGGVSLTRATGTGGLNSADAHKTYVAGSLTIVKKIVNDNGGTAVVGNFGITTNAGTLVFGAGVESPAHTFTYTSNTLTNLAPSTYSLHEGTLAGYSEGTWGCVGNAGAVNSDPQTGSVAVAANENVTCTITNNDIAPKLHLRKVVTNNNGGTATVADFTLNADGSGSNDLTGTSPVDSGAGLQADTWTLSETPDAAASGKYTASDWVCVGGSQGDSTHITVGIGGEATCTITNNDIAPKLHLRKIVTNDNGGTATVADFTLNADGTGANDLSGTSPVDSGPGLQADTWTLSETPDAAASGKYTASAWVCVGGSQGDSTHITLGPNDEATCTITNNDIAPKLHLRKIVTNNNGGTATVADFTLSADGTGTNDLSGTSPVDSGAGLQADTWTLSETPDAAASGKYSASAWVCVGGSQGDSTHITVGVAGEATCTITNDDIPPQLHLRKIVINNNGGTAVAANWTLTANGTGANDLSGSTPVDSGPGLQADTWALGESGPAGYSSGNGYVCVGGTQVGQSITVGVGGSATCTITNDDIPGTIIIRKITDPLNSSSVFGFDATGTGYNDFTLTGDSAGNANLNSQTLNAGSYSVTETTMPLGWLLTGVGSPGSSNCELLVSGSGTSSGTGDVNTATATITLGLGDTIRCTFENSSQGVTRTQGFWATHTPLANIAWFGGKAFGHEFPGVASVAGIGDTLICGVNIDTLAKLMGGFWADISKQCGGHKRSPLDQARMQLLQQLLAAELNASAFGSVPSGGSGKFAQWEAAFCTGNLNDVKNAQQEAASFNTSGDNQLFTPGTSADAKFARSIANTCFWDNPSNPSLLSPTVKFGLPGLTSPSSDTTKSGNEQLLFLRTVGPAFAEDKDDKTDKPD